MKSVPLLGVDRGPISGIAPGASVIAYRVCRPSCYQSDSVAAVQQAILDGVDVINFSVGGGANAYSDPVELAFLDAYGAGISVNASAGNSGPGAATAEHTGPWVTTVAASTSDRQFESELTLTAPGGETYTKVGSTVTQGVTDTPDRAGHGGPRLHREHPVRCPVPDRFGDRQGRAVPARHQRPGGEGLQRSAGRGRRDDPVQPHRAATSRPTTTGCRPSTSRARTPTCWTSSPRTRTPPRPGRRARRPPCRAT